MVLNVVILKILCYSLVSCIRVAGFSKSTQDQTTSRTNTLFDDADDIQRQLDNEARDKFKYGQPKPIWVFHFPTQFPILNFKEELVRRPRNMNNFRLYNEETIRDDYEMTTSKALQVSKEWSYNDQHRWFESYPDCGGRSQSPANLPVEGLIKARGARQLLFCNYDGMPSRMTLINNGKTLTLSGEWAKNKRPLVYGGAAHSRRYLFHSLTIHWPSEHMVGGLQYPMETQALHISADYQSFDEAIEYSSSDPQAFLGIVNIYKFSDHTHAGLKLLLKTALKMGTTNGTILNGPLSFFNPPFTDYVCYQGSLTLPPCTESVLWLVRGRSLTVTREVVEAAHGSFSDNPGPKKFFIRHLQPLNDRKIFLFHE